MLGTINLLVSGATMEKAVVLSKTSAATGYPETNLLGYNLKRWWKPTSTADQAIVIDLGSAKTVGAVGFFIANYLTAHGPTTTPKFKVSYSSDNSSWSVFFNVNIASYFTTGNPCVIIPVGTPQTYRYWKIEFNGMATTIQVAQIFLGTIYNFATAGEWPRNDSPRFDNDRVDRPGGGIMTNRRAKMAPVFFTRKLLFASAAAFANLRNAHNNSFGSWAAFIYWEDDGVTDITSVAMVCRFDTDSVPEVQETVGLYRPSVDFRQEPYLQDGEVM